MEGLLEPDLVEESLGQAEVRATFAVGKGAIAGCYIQSGKLQRNCSLSCLLYTSPSPRDVEESRMPSSA